MSNPEKLLSSRPLTPLTTGKTHRSADSIHVYSSLSPESGWACSSAFFAATPRNSSRGRGNSIAAHSAIPRLPSSLYSSLSPPTSSSSTRKLTGLPRRGGGGSVFSNSEASRGGQLWTSYSARSFHGSPPDFHGLNRPHPHAFWLNHFLNSGTAYSRNYHRGALFSVASPSPRLEPDMEDGPPSTSCFRRLTDCFLGTSRYFMQCFGYLELSVFYCEEIFCIAWLVCKFMFGCWQTFLFFCYVYFIEIT